MRRIINSNDRRVCTDAKSEECSRPERTSYNNLYLLHQTFGYLVKFYFRKQYFWAFCRWCLHIYDVAHAVIYNKVQKIMIYFKNEISSGLFTKYVRKWWVWEDLLVKFPAATSCPGSFYINHRVEYRIGEGAQRCPFGFNPNGQRWATELFGCLRTYFMDGPFRNSM